MEPQLGKPPILPITAKLLFTNSFPCFYRHDGITPYLLATTGRRLWPFGLSATTKRMLRHPIYQLPLEGGYDPLVYQLLLKGCYDTLFTSNHWKDATTPYLPATTERRLWPPGLFAATKRMLRLIGCSYTLFTSFCWKEKKTPCRLVAYPRATLPP